jgi:hypothetical protein
VAYEAAQYMLEQNNWDLELVNSQLKQQLNSKKDEEQLKEGKVVELFNEFPTLEYEQAYAIMKKHNYQLEYARQEASCLFKIAIYFQLLSPQNQPIEVIRAELNKDDDGYTMITHLNQQRPIQNLYYKLYREAQCQNEINYLSLGSSLNELAIYNNSFVFVKKDQTPPI